MTLVDLVDASLSTDLVANVYETILRPSFSRDELPDDGPLGGLDGSGNCVLSVVVEEGEPVAAALTEYAPGVDIDLLGYLAARPGDRSRGLGTVLLDHLASRWRQRSVSLALAELHDPRAWPETPSERAAARIRFYARWGCDVLDVPWVQPALGPGCDRVADMLLAVLWRLPGGTDEVAAAPVAAWTEEYYLATEGPADAASPDPQHDALVKRLTTTPTIGIRPLADYEQVVPLTV